MGVFPEPARRADDVSRLAPIASHFEDETVAWLPRAGRETRRRSLRRTDQNGARRTGIRRLSGTLALGLVAGFGLPQAAFAPAYFAPPAQAHDRVDASPRTAQALARPPAQAASAESASAWNGLPVPEQEPA